MATLPSPPASATSASVWTGRVLTALFALFMLGASIAPKLLGMAVAAETIEPLGWSADYVLMIGVFELTFVLLYLCPRTAERWRPTFAWAARSSATRSSVSTSRSSCGAACG